MSDPDKLRTRLSDLSEKLTRWNTMYDILNGNHGEPDEAPA
ncbi:hypothetical protein [Saccharopolyspora pogona]|nr:hypothetical protein [Saccharopolyspora pogona]